MLYIASHHRLQVDKVPEPVLAALTEQILQGLIQLHRKRHTVRHQHSDIRRAPYYTVFALDAPCCGTQRTNHRHSLLDSVGCIRDQAHLHITGCSLDISLSSTMDYMKSTEMLAVNPFLYANEGGYHWVLEIVKLACL